MRRDDNLRRLKSETFDLCVIGAGASGTGCALDAALRGLKVALIEREDFAAGTSSKSTKLIHGGVRYLEQAVKNFDFAQLKQVRHGLEERQIVLDNAPHLAHPLGLITPVSNWFEGLYYSIGMKVYGWFAAGRDQLPKSRWLSKSAALKRMPGLSPKIHSAILYYDGQLDDARYCVALARSAHAAGAAVSNHLEVVGFQRTPAHQLTAALVHDAIADETFEIRAHRFLNCTGPYADHVRLLANAQMTPRIRPSKGVHMVLPYSVLSSEDAMLIPKTKDGRVVFALPFEGQVMVGTTDNDYENLAAEPVLEASEVDFLLETLQPFAAQTVDKSQVRAGFGGLRPLIAATPEKGTKNLVRDHEVEHDAKSGLFSLLGGKWTTYRLMAEDAIDAVCATFERLDLRPCSTRNHILTGGAGYRFDDWRQLSENTGLSADTCQHLMRKYGNEAPQVAALIRENAAWGDRLHPDFPYIAAEAVFAARSEMACTPRDFLARRIRFEIADWDATSAAVDKVAAALAAVWGWDAEETNRQAAQCKATLQQFKMRI